MNKNNNKFIESMKKARERKKLSKTQLANLIDMSVSTICDIEAGRKNPSVSTLVLIANVLQISLDDIFLN